MGVCLRLHIGGMAWGWGGRTEHTWGRVAGSTAPEQRAGVAVTGVGFDCEDTETSLEGVEQRSHAICGLALAVPLKPSGRQWGQSHGCGPG